MNKIILCIIMIIMTFLGSFAGLCLKKASKSMEISILSVLKNYNLYLGGSLYLVSAILNIILLKYMEYSIVLPLTSITYVWTLVLAYLILKEKITKRKIAGVSLILIGAVVIVL